jgi:hypothetical protein
VVVLFGALLREHTRFEDRTLFKKIPMESLNKIPPHENKIKMG